MTSGRKAGWGSLMAMLLLAGCAAPPPGGPGLAGNDTDAPPPPAALPPTPPPPPPAPSRMAHQHAAFALFLEGERVRFNDTDYDLTNRRNFTAHLHSAEGGDIIHLEGSFPNGVPDVTLASFFRNHGVSFQPGALTLDTFDHHNGTAWPDNATHRWRVWVQPAAGNWTLAPDGPGLVLRDHDRILVTYGEPSPEELARERAAVRQFGT